MAYFGEIVEPGSRTAWEDWDEIICNENYPELRLDKNDGIPEFIDTFIILEGRFLSDYIQSQNELDQVNAIPGLNLHLYRTKKANNYVCVIKDYNLVHSSEIVQLLKKYISVSTDTLAVLTKPLVEYQIHESVTRDYLVRSICASKDTSRPPSIKFPLLEQPNIISGVSAGVMTWREITDKPALSIVVYMEHQDDQIIPELQDLLETYKIVTHKTKGNRDTVLNSNLYI